MSTPTLQFVLFLWMASMIALIIFGAVHRRKTTMSVDEHLRSNLRVQREIQQIELHRPTHIIRGDGWLGVDPPPQ